jgi:transketolase
MNDYFEPDIESVKFIAKRARKHLLEMIYESNSPHIGSCLSVIDILVAAYSLSDYSANTTNSRFNIILSKGHAAAALYAVFIALNKIPKSTQNSYSINGSNLYGHLDHFASNEIPLTTGSLGHGLPFGVGLALSSRMKEENSKKTIVIMSDGELDEGTTWESLLIANHFKLENLTIVVDRNGLQSIRGTEETIKLEPLRSKFLSFGWEVLEVDGHSLPDLLANLQVSEGPKCLIANTTKGKGVSFMEGQTLWHYRSPSEVEFKSALSEILGS